MAECGLSKPEIRRLAEHWGLPTWNKPATPCLSSRIAYGEPITPERLAMIDRAERFLRERVRAAPGAVSPRRRGADRVPVDQVSKFADLQFRREVVEYLKSLGFKYVSLDLEGFRSGSMNAVLTRC